MQYLKVMEFKDCFFSHAINMENDTLILLDDNCKSKMFIDLFVDPVGLYAIL